MKKEDVPLTADQEKEISEILERIRAGLDIPVDSQFEEPALIFNPGAFDVNK